MSIITASFSVALASDISPTKRTILPQNKSWKFIKQNVSGAEAVGFNDGAWQSIHLPHSFEMPYWMTDLAQPPYIGWYRKHFSIDASIIADKKRVFIQFEGAFLVAEVYINGTQIGEHKGGYTGFSYDITSAIHSGDNVIAVKLDATWNAQIAPRAGEHIFSGGIYRDVYLVITSPVQIPWCGTFVATPQVSSSSATIRAKTEIRNNTTAAKSCRVKQTVYDEDDQSVASFESTRSIAAGATDTCAQSSSSLSSPHLWSTTTPYMYTLLTQVYDNGTLVDDYTTPFGIRSIRWDKDNGFFINEQHLWLQGCNVHQDHAGWCDAITDSGSYRDVKLVKDCGMNFIRGSHYPHDPAFYDACDRLGVCVWSEFPYWGIGGFEQTDPPSKWNASAYPYKTAEQEPFDQNVLSQVAEGIRIYRNHPSVIIWSLCNEIEFTNSSAIQKSKDLFAKLVTLSHKTDSTRLAAFGGAWDDFTNLADVDGYNGGQVSIMNPGIPNMVTEYGSCFDDRPGKWGDNDGCYNGAYGDLQAENNAPVKYSWRAGVCIWSGFHHGSCYAMGNTGLIDHSRLPLRSYYFYRNIYANIAPPTWPVAGTAAKLKLTADNDTITDDGRSDCQLIVQVQNAAGARISNQPDITLTDKSGLGMFPTGSSITFNGGALNKCVRDGLAAIEFRTYNAGTITIEATSAGLTPSSVVIYAKHVPDQDATAALVYEKAASSAGRYPLTIMKSIGGRIEIPARFQGTRIRVSLYNSQGRLLDTDVVKQNTSHIQKSLKTHGIYLVKMQATD